MALVRWDPAVEVDSLQSEVNRLFDSFFSGSSGANSPTRRRWVPAMDLAETEQEFVLTADLPGLSEDDVSIEIKDNTLTVSGERSEHHEDEKKGFHRVERSFGQFSRTMTLPEGVNAEDVVANFDQGVLEVRIPKPAERKPHRVEISAGRTVEGKGSEKE